MKFCEKPFNGIYLAPNGEVWPCGWMHYKIGNLYDQEMDEIWHGEAAEKARKSILDGSFAFCRKISCPLCERNEILDVPKEDIERLAVVTDMPERISISNDRICNVACTTCRTSMFYADEAYREKIDKSLKKILPYANKAKYLNANGNGEFLANSNFLDFVGKLRPESPESVIFFQTNGILFDKEHWDRFSHLSANYVKIAVTVNSLRKENYRYLSGGFDYLKKVKENLRFLCSLRREEKIKFLNVAMVVQECNFWEIPEFIHTLLHSGEYAIDRITLRPVYKWFGMDDETYWFKNVLNPLHPYHKEYLKILEDDCWSDPKVYDWGCHNLREAQPHPLAMEKIYNRLLLDIYENPQKLSPEENIKLHLEKMNLRRIGVFGENEFSKAILRLLQRAGAEIAFQLTWFRDEGAGIPKVSMQNFRPEMTDAILLLDFYDKQNLTNSLRSLKFQGRILTAEELINGERSK